MEMLQNASQYVSAEKKKITNPELNWSFFYNLSF